MHEDFCPAEPSAYVVHDVAQKREGRSRRIQMAEPPAEGGGIRHTVRIFDRGRGVFPGVTFQKVPPQRLAAGDQAVMAIRERKRRQESERLAAQIAESPAYPNPVVIFVVSLLATAAMTDDGFAKTDRAVALDRSSVSRGPIHFEVALCGRK